MSQKSRRVIKSGGVAIAALCAIGVLTLPLVRSSYASRSTLSQRVQVDKADNLFGDGPTPIGSPQQMIISDPKAIVVVKDGVNLIDDSYLKKKNIYPLQLKTVDFAIENARMVLVIGVLLGWLAYFLVRRRERKEELAALPLAPEPQ